jgi:hypothetical protein
MNSDNIGTEQLIVLLQLKQPSLQEGAASRGVARYPLKKSPFCLTLA